MGVCLKKCLGPGVALGKLDLFTHGIGLHIDTDRAVKMLLPEESSPTKVKESIGFPIEVQKLFARKSIVGVMNRIPVHPAIP
jgi:hypothetical protein